MTQYQAALIIGEKIRYYRTMNDLTQEQLAEIVDSTGSYIGRIERGEQNVKLETLERIAHALKLDLYILFDQEQHYLENYPWVEKSLKLLLNQDEKDQKKAYRILKELFTD